MKNSSIVKHSKREILLLIIFACIITASPVNAASSNSQNLDSTLITLESRSADIRWIYKNENGKTYKRLYNYSTQTWLSDWILIS
ncbi:MAG: hypothetical protein Q4B85_03610 [Lachnospiraceae bacterium]|nr:hypothetical protein [Lachnospiraceae bacterium]